MTENGAHADLGEQDPADQTLFGDEDREKLLQDKKNMTREKLITMLIDAHKSYAKMDLEKTAAINEKTAAVNEKTAAINEKTAAVNEKTVMEKDYQKMMDNMLSAQQELQLEQDVTKKLMKRIDVLEADEDGERPVVGLITDNTAKVVFKYIDGPSCIWRMINIDKLSHLSQGIGAISSNVINNGNSDVMSPSGAKFKHFESNSKTLTRHKICLN